MPLIRRTSHRSDRYLRYKTILLIVGLGFLLAGIRLRMDWAVWVAIVFFGAAFLLRFLPGSTGRAPPDE